MRKLLLSLAAAASLLSGGALAQPATVAITFDYWRSAIDDAMWPMYSRGLVGTYFVAPSTVGQSGGPDLSSLTLMKMIGWEIGVYSDQNMVTALANNRITANQWLWQQKAQMLSFGFPTRSFAPNQRAWSASLANLTRGGYDAVRVADDTSAWQGYPIPDRNYVRKGGTASLSSADTAASLCAQLSSLIASGPNAWIVVAHKVGSTPDSLTISATEFYGFLDCLKTAKDAGQIRVVTFSEAMSPP